MIDGLRPYPEMKPSGVDWLPALPNGWEIHRAKYSFREADDRSESGGEELLSVSHKTGVTPRSQKNITMFMAESYEGHKVCRPDDIVVNTMWAWMAAIGVSRHVGIVSPAYGIYRPRTAERFEPMFLDYLLRTEAYRAEYLRSSRGVTTSRLRLYPPDFLNIPFVQPPLDEQRLIVRFLGWHGAQTAKLVRAKKKIIALLNEQKQAIIHRAVTRGLDPNAKLKPSGIPWLGDVPVGWEVTRLARLVRNSNAGEVIDKGWWGRGEETLYTCARKQLASDFSSFPDWKRTTGLDLLLTRNGTPYVHRPIPNAIYSNVVQRINLRDGKNREYIALALEIATRHMKGYGVSIESLNYDMWKVLFVLVPRFDEQEQIVSFAKAETAIYDAGIEAIEKEVGLIQEFRTRLIADVVTGKPDVRAAAAGLPEVTEIEPIDDPTEVDDLDEAIDATENGEVAA